VGRHRNKLFLNSLDLGLGKNMNKICFILLGVSLAGGCAGTGERRIQVEPTDFSNYLNQKKNVMTYDQAVKE
jgi:hypothetical protein